MDVTTTVTQTVAHELIERAGIEPQIVTSRSGGRSVESVRWNVPEEAQTLTGGHEFTWATDEALTWALVIIATVDEPEMLVWK